MPSNPHRARGGSFGPFGGIPPGVKFLLVALATLSIGTSALSAWKSREVGAFIAQQLWFRPEDLLGGKVWQLATYTLFSPDPMGLILSALVLWIFAGTLDPPWGTRPFLTFYFLSVFLSCPPPPS